MFKQASVLRDKSEDNVMTLAKPIAYRIDEEIAKYTLTEHRRLIIRFESPNDDVTAKIVLELHRAGWSEVNNITSEINNPHYTKNHTLIPVDKKGNVWVAMQVPKRLRRGD